MLEIKDVSIRAGEFAVKGISLNVEDSACYVIIGPTGSGKTIFLEAIMGFKKLISGEIRLGKKNITDMPAEQRGISYLPQDLALFPHLNVKENILYGLKIKGITDRQYFDLADDLIDTLGIKHLLNRVTHNLSGGERQRVALVRAIATGNKYLLLDEPFSALHEGMKSELWFLLKELQERYRLTVLMVTHDVEEAFLLADTISIMINGRLEQTGKKEEVYRYPATIDAAEFFGIRNLFDAEITDKENIVRCKELNAELFVKASLNHRSKNFKIGIRAEDIMILRTGRTITGQDNIIEGIITDIFRKGATDIVLLKPQNSKRIIEIEMPFYAFQKLDIKKGLSAGVILKAECIFCLQNSHDQEGY